MKTLRFLVLAPAGLVFLGAGGGLSAEAAPRDRRVPGEYPTIQAAIDAALDGDTVRVAAGIYGESIRWEGKSIALIGAGPTATILDPSAGPGGRCLTLENVPAPAQIRGLACRNGSADTGGGILIRGGDLALRYLTLQSNTATAGPGGGMRVAQSTVTVEGCTFLDNDAPEASPPPEAVQGQLGGGLYASDYSHVSVSASSFARNSAERGGGMAVEYDTETLVRGVTFEDNTGGLYISEFGTVDVAESAFLRNRRHGGLQASFVGFLNVRDTLFEGNVSDRRGGGMSARMGEVQVTRSIFRDNTSALGGGLAIFEGSLTLTDSQFIGNHATANGGGLGLIIGNLQIERTRFLGNEAAGNGGGVYVSTGSTSVESTVFRGNRAGADGGGMATDAGHEVSWENCAFSDNIAGTIGGGVNIYGESGVVSMVGSTLTRNVAGERGGGMAASGDGPLSILNTIFWGNRPDQLWFHDPALRVSVTYSDVQGGFPGEGNIDADPLFLDAARGDLRLRPSSPARDAGLDNGALSPVDLTGNPRVFGPAPDMGAYEITPPGPR